MFSYVHIIKYTKLHIALQYESLDLYSYSSYILFERHSPFLIEVFKNLQLYVKMLKNFLYIHPL